MNEKKKTIEGLFGKLTANYAIGGNSFKVTMERFEEKRFHIHGIEYFFMKSQAVNHFRKICTFYNGIICEFARQNFVKDF